MGVPEKVMAIIIGYVIVIAFYAIVLFIAFQIHPILTIPAAVLCIYAVLRGTKMVFERLKG